MKKIKFSIENNQKALAASMNIVYSNRAKVDCGALISVSSSGVAVHSKNKEAAVKLLEFLSEEKFQQLYRKINFEYPYNPRVKPMEESASLEGFKEDQLLMETIEKVFHQVQIMIDQVGW